MSSKTDYLDRFKNNFTPEKLQLIKGIGEDCIGRRDVSDEYLQTVADKHGVELQFVISLFTLFRAEN